MKLKKVFVFAGLILFISGFAFSSEKPDMDLEVSLDLPFEIGGIYSENINNPDGETGSQGGVLLGVNVGFDAMFTPYVGIGLNLGIYENPLYFMAVSGQGYNQSTKETKPFVEHTGFMSSGNFNAPAYISSSLFVGPLFRPVYGEKFTLELTPGIGYRFTDIFAIIPSAGGSTFNFALFDFGLGLDLSMTFKINEKINLNVGLVNSFYFIQFVKGHKNILDNNKKIQNTINVSSSFNQLIDIQLSPRIGMLFYL